MNMKNNKLKMEKKIKNSKTRKMFLYQTQILKWCFVPCSSKFYFLLNFYELYFYFLILFFIRILNLFYINFWFIFRTLKSWKIAQTWQTFYILLCILFTTQKFPFLGQLFRIGFRVFFELLFWTIILTIIFFNKLFCIFL